MFEIEKEFEILKNSGNNTATARVQKTGRLGFSMDGNKLMKIDETKFVQIAKKKGEASDDLYLIVSNEEKEGSFRIVKAGSYFYVNASTLFDDLNYNYKEDTYAYRIKVYDENNNVFKLKRYFPNERNKK